MNVLVAILPGTQSRILAPKYVLVTLPLRDDYEVKPEPRYSCRWWACLIAIVIRLSQSHRANAPCVYNVLHIDGSGSRQRSEESRRVDMLLMCGSVKLRASHTMLRFMRAYPGIPISRAHCVCHWCVAAFEILRSDLEGNRGGYVV